MLVLLLVIPAFGLVLYGHLEQRRIETARVGEGAIAISQLAAANQENFIKNSRQLLATLADIRFLVLATDQSFCQTHFSNLRKLLPDYLTFGLIETNGVVFCSAEPTNRSMNLGDRPYFQRVVQTREFSTGDFQVGRLSGQPSLNFGYPVLDEHGQLKRVLFASLKLSLLSEAAARIRLPAGGTVTVIDRNGNVLAHHPESGKWVGKALSASPVVQRILTQKGGVFEMPGLDGTRSLHAVTAITNGETPIMFVSVGIPAAVSYAPANEALVRNLIVLGLVAVVVLAAARSYAQRFFLRPVNTLVGVAKQFAEGNLNARTGTIQGSAELLQLGQAFNDMAVRLQKRQAEIEQAHQQISSLNQGLERRVEERTSQLEEANKELASFSYSVSHDLRAPLRHVGAYVEMLRQESGAALTENGRRHLAVISQAARQMGNLIDDLLSFSREGRAELRRTLIRMEEPVNEVLHELKNDTEGRNIQWTIGALPQVFADWAMMKQVWMNLFSNAAKYTRHKERAEVNVGCRLKESEFEFYVRDNGAGFDMQYVDKLFGVFQRLHSEGEFEGTGIGLANVRRIVSRHGGRTWAEGKIGEGATFYFTLPNPARE
jgi:signal transduction histidine kinase